MDSVSQCQTDLLDQVCQIPLVLLDREEVHQNLELLVREEVHQILELLVLLDHDEADALQDCSLGYSSCPVAHS